MSANLTAIPANILVGTYIIVIGYSLSTIISTITCLIIIALIYLTPNLHSATNLLIFNTCLSSLAFSSILIIITFFYYMEPMSTDWSCRIQAYFTYVAVCLVVYSYVIQAISRVFWTVLYKYNWLLTIKCHIYLICFQILLSFLLPLSSLVTTDVVFRPFKLCSVSLQYKIHLLYILSVTYILPILTIILLYILIYRHTKRSSVHVGRSSRNARRDTELARNILILFGIFLFGGVPLTIYIVLSSKTGPLLTAFYFFALLTPPVSVTIEKLATVVLNKEIRKVAKKRWMTYYAICLPSSTRVQQLSPSHNTDRRVIFAVNRIVPTTPAYRTEQEPPSIA